MPTKKVSDDMRRRCVMACDNCKRRKERCDGKTPCRRCSARRPAAECHYSGQRETSSPNQSLRMRSTKFKWITPKTPVSTQTARCETGDFLGSPFSNVCSLVFDEKGDMVFFGDSANESFLQQIQHLVAQTLGSCPFVDHPIKYHTDPNTATPSSISLVTILDPPPKPGIAEAKYFVRWSMRATNGLLGVCDKDSLEAEILQWLEHSDQPPDLSTAFCYLVLANGALQCPGDQVEVADAYFSYAAFLIKLASEERLNHKSILCHCFIFFYHLHTGRRDAAYHSIGVACRGACSMGLHLPNHSPPMNNDSFGFRDRLWKALRMMDIFISGSLGRPVCTTETRNTKMEQGYSSAIDMTAIIGTVLKEVYGTSAISKEFIANMTQEHRLWAKRMVRGLEADGIDAAYILEKYDDEPNLRLCHMKESYYWSIMLLTRPVLLERVKARIVRARPDGDQDSESSGSVSDTALVYASVDSALRSIGLLEALLPRTDLPKQLPFVVHSTITAALTLGLATFADLDQVFPLRGNLKTADKLLKKFELHDDIARYYRQVLEQLQSVCNEYIEQRNSRIVKQKSHLVTDLFGCLNEEVPLPSTTFGKKNAWFTGDIDELVFQSPVGSSSTSYLTEGSSLETETETDNSGGSSTDLSLDFLLGSQITDLSDFGDISNTETFNLSSFGWL
ncbi:hypothetical protein FVEN_g4351 [Fusarium venenatum]|uniref:Zn(2)-C6 fungal-type domain-containing protein n=1 Tax=Fusarium venenatum TaxID=56646 RepID=A0A2L2TRI1_9HYPO|nr:uncharacterized protein FVRRES_02768 [Fusarium venenatum]KAG8357868.1 hypothetical protein FVEN_g4351 [Fusarium venenatum]KAH7004152.1 hypothetical protein EDB82DRAFT_486212 [Fusarium venenatum]CEI66256.1 unnamed protein product [Fusarium venenatum]